jgi:LuxR family transcriptional regulator, maltose regulon positive regulatory protein
MPDLAEEIRADLSHAWGTFARRGPALTAAELRLLPMLPTHLSFPEIAAQMFLSRHTVKSHAKSIYQKLGACSRSQAVSRLRDLGLLDR